MLYKYCRPDGFDILLHSRLKASRVNDFNDPFDLAFGMDNNKASKRIKSEFKKDPTLIEKWSEKFALENIPYNKNSKREMLQNVYEYLTSRREIVIENIRKEMNEKYGITCLSKHPDIIQMWSHYAESHKGIVVGLDGNEFVGNPLKLVEVKYHETMFLFPYTASIPMSKRIQKEYEEGFIDVLGRKEKKWSYEEEVRLLAGLEEQDSDGNYYVEIPPSSIKELYLGLRAPETSEIIAKALKQREGFRHLKIFKMEKSFKSYKLKRKKI